MNMFDIINNKELHQLYNLLNIEKSADYTFGLVRELLQPIASVDELSYTETYGVTTDFYTATVEGFKLRVKEIREEFEEEYEDVELGETYMSTYFNDDYGIEIWDNSVEDWIVFI